MLISRSMDRLESTRNEILHNNRRIEVRTIVADFSKGREISDEIAEKLLDVPVGILGNFLSHNIMFAIYKFIYYYT